jgi:hypothetical protein
MTKNKKEKKTSEINIRQTMQILTPDPELKRLEKLVGTWKLTGRTPDSNADNISGWSIFEWMPGGFFLKVSGEIIYKGFKIISLEIIAYDAVKKIFFSNGYSNISGTVFSYQWDIQANNVTHWMESAKYTGVLSDGGRTLTGGWRPVEGNKNPENVSYDAVMTRVK